MRSNITFWWWSYNTYARFELMMMKLQSTRFELLMMTLNLHSWSLNYTCRYWFKGGHCIFIFCLVRMPLKKLTNQLWMWSGKSNCAILSSKVWCRIVLKALLKSIAMTITYGLVISKCVTLWSSVIIAAVVEPQGLKANWSWNTREVVGFWSAG